MNFVDQLCITLEQTLTFNKLYYISYYKLAELIHNDFPEGDTERTITEGTLMNMLIEYESGVIGQVVPDGIIFNISVNYMHRNKGETLLNALAEQFQLEYFCLWRPEDGDGADAAVCMSRNDSKFVKKLAINFLNEQREFFHHCRIYVALFDDEKKIIKRQDIEELFCLAESTFGQARCSVSKFELSCLPKHIAELFMDAEE